MISPGVMAGLDPAIHVAVEIGPAANFLADGRDGYAGQARV
jgi:hypothetical protein